eukprot:jgi/Mesen1/4581/ME000232S03834
MSALFDFQSFLVVVLLVICTCTYVKIHFPKVLHQRTGFRGFFWKAARIGALPFPIPLLDLVPGPWSLGKPGALEPVGERQLSHHGRQLPSFLTRAVGSWACIWPGIGLEVEPEATHLGFLAAGAIASLLQIVTRSINSYQEQLDA